MAILKIKLSRNLRRNILRGHPWVYKESVVPMRGISRAVLCEISDTKGPIAWGFYDPHSPLTLRILSLEKVLPLNSFLKISLNVLLN